MVNELILNKIKLLLNLTNSPNENEAATARDMADKLIAKYNITEEELKSIEDKPPPYNETNLLFSTIGLESWRNQLALGVCTRYDCFLVQEEAVPVEGFSQFSYFVLGDEEDMANVKFAFSVLEKKVEELILLNCAGKGPIYSHSYSEGVVESIKQNIHFFDLPIVYKTNTIQIQTKTTEHCNLSKQEEKQRPIKNSIDINSQSIIKDIHAYFKGINDGNKLDLQDMLELADRNRVPEQLEGK